MARTQIGNVLTESNGDELTIYLNVYGDEEPDCIEVDGKAANLIFDPAVTAGRNQLTAFLARINEAVAEVDQRIEAIYGQLKVGDWCGQIRLAKTDQERCGTHVHTSGARCSRIAHPDGHHVVVNEAFEVTAVSHPDSATAT